VAHIHAPLFGFFYFHLYDEFSCGVPLQLGEFIGRTRLTELENARVSFEEISLWKNLFPSRNMDCTDPSLFDWKDLYIHENPCSKGVEELYPFQKSVKNLYLSQLEHACQSSSNGKERRKCCLI
jgi:hypothetical protein